MSTQYVQWPPVSSGGGGGSGTVTSISVVTANGLAGTVANPTTTPAITLSTTVTGILKGNGTAISAAIPGTDYQPAGNYALQDLSNLTSTAINLSLVPALNGTISLGSASKFYSFGYIDFLSDGTNTSVNVTGRFLNDSGANPAIDWQNRRLYNPSSTLMFDWESTFLNAHTNLISNVVDPVSAQDAATKNYVDTHGGSGTVTSVSVVSANGLAGTVATATTTPAITLSTTITGILQGNGAAISAATTGNLTDAGTDGIVVTNGTGAVLGSGTSLAQHVADTTHNGYLSSTDWNTFNGKQAAGSYITALTGDVTASGPGSSAASLVATSNSTLTTLSALSLPGSQVTGNISGNAANITASSNSTLTTLSVLSLPGSQVTGNISGNAANVTGVIAIANGGTGQTTANAGFDALSPMTTAGDIIYENATPTAARLPIGSTGQALTVVGGLPAWQTVGVGNASAAAIGLTSNVSSGGAGSPIKYDTVIYDTAGAYSTSTGIYTCPDTAKYHVSVITFSNNANNTQIYINGTGFAYISRSSSGPATCGSISIVCNAGDTIFIAPDAADTYTGNVPYLNYLSIEQIH